VPRLGKWVAAALLALASPVVAAIETGPDSPPVEILDRRITLGARTLLLPEGHWYYVGGEFTITIGAPPFLANALLDTAYLVQVEHGAFAQAMSVSLLRSPLAVRGWSQATCAGAETYYVDDEDGLGDLPDCVAIDGVTADAFDRYLRARAGRIGDWLRAHQVRVPETTIGVRYVRGSLSNFGSITLFVPAEHFDSDASAAAWAASLRAALRPVFENRQPDGRVPALPLVAPASTAHEPDDAKAAPASH
jgi:hypothetical protein